MKYTHILLSLIIFAFAATLVSGQSSRNVVLSDYGKLPLSFEVNRGQSDVHVKFLSRGRGYTLFLTANEAVISLRKPASQSPKQKSLSAGALDQPQTHSAIEVTVLRMQLAGAKTSRAAAAQELPGKVNYFIGNDPSKWRTNVPTYAEVKYEGVYPGVDLVYYGNQGQLEYDFVVAPGANPNRIRLNLHSAKELRVDKYGDLVLAEEGGQVRFQKPIAYQEIDGDKRPVDASYVLASDRKITFQIGDYDRTHPLVIDPVLLYSTYLGGDNVDEGNGIAADASGNAYVTGGTESFDFPTVNAFESTNGGAALDGFVTKFNPSGFVLYSTFLGAGANTVNPATAIAVDGSGNAYVTGGTNSSTFPTFNALQPTLGGSNNAFVAELNSSGSALVFSTYLGGSGSDGGNGIAVSASGNVYVTGFTSSTNFPTANALQPALGGPNGENAFVVELKPSGAGFVYSTYLGGGNGHDYGTALAIDSSGNTYVTGIANSTNFPTVNPFQPTKKGSAVQDAFVSKLNPTGSALVYSTYLGGSGSVGGSDSGAGIAADASGNAYVTGTTYSTDFPTTPNAYQPALAGNSTNAFITKFNPTGALVYSTYFGAVDQSKAIAVDSSGNAYVTGFTTSSNFPTANAIQPNLIGGFGNAFVSVLDASGSGLLFSTYLGGSGNRIGGGDAGQAIAVDAPGNIYLTGGTGSADFPTKNAFQSAPGVGNHISGFVSKISSASGNTPTSTALVSSLDPSDFSQSISFTATVTAQVSGTPTGAVTFMDGATSLGVATLNASAQTTLTTASLAPGTHSITAVYGGDGTFSSSTSTPLNQVVSAPQFITVSPNPASVGMGHTLQFTATGQYSDGSSADLTTFVTWSSSNTAIATISNAAGTQGLTTGVDAAKAAATITASVGATSGTAQLTVTHHK